MEALFEVFDSDEGPLCLWLLWHCPWSGLMPVTHLSTQGVWQKMDQDHWHFCELLVMGGRELMS